jgi:hypothetical protein
MFVVDFFVSLLFGSLYGGLIMGLAMLAAIPYGIWQGVRRLWNRRPGGPHGDSRAG